MYKVLEMYKNCYLLEHPLGFMAVQLGDDIEDYNAKHDPAEHNKKNAIAAFNRLKEVI